MAKKDRKWAENTRKIHKIYFLGFQGCLRGPKIDSEKVLTFFETFLNLIDFADIS